MTTTVRLLAALFALAVLAPAAMANPVYDKIEDTFYLRGEGCGATENLYLDDRSAVDEYDGCGTIGGLPVNEAIGAEDSLSTTKAYDLILDGDGQVEVVIRVESWVGDGFPGAGQSVVDVSLSAHPIATGGTFTPPVTLGSGTSEILVAGQDNATHTFTFDIPDTAHETHVSGFTLKVSVRGANVNVNNLGTSGDSYFTIDLLEEVV